MFAASQAATTYVGITVRLPITRYAGGMKPRRNPRYHEPRRYAGVKPRRAERTASIGAYFAGAMLIGIGGGTAWSVTTPEGREAFIANAKNVAVSAGMIRERAPREGDYWRGCDDARAAGTAPIYRGEPGYREGMDGDNDGIACEPYR
ncbi:excalibur calcium-binding domain-containing protein [Sphingopyxis granuli]|uniref:excalibur calcium-binding domain-containing protein n=1 Tax=Sphingopyxis granuli TaxID=267128 RepID=UPI001F1B8F7F|nr:excalibur calcium-binding domain-containing protein [Sphingopyxis granuli]